MANVNIKEVEGGETTTVTSSHSIELDDGVNSTWASVVNLAVYVWNYLTSLTAKTTLVDADQIPLADSAASNAGKKITWANFMAQAAAYTQTLANKTLTTPTIASFTNAQHDHSNAAGGGAISSWIADANTWTYASADSPTFTLTVNADVTAFIGVGCRIKLTQTTAKYFIVTAISYSAPNTTITIYGGTDYTLANAAISSPYYSFMKSPIGFPLDPTKWTVTTTDSQDKQKTTPTANTWYGGANAWSTGTNVTIILPIGAWKTSYSLYQYVLDTSATIATMEVTLSTSNNSESDSTMTCSIGGNGASSTMTVRQTSYASKHITVASKTTYYLLGRTESSNIDEINIPGSAVRSILIEAVCAYL